MQQRTPRKINLQIPEGLTKPKYMYALSMPHLLDPESKPEEQPLLLGDALQAVKPAIPDDEIMTIFVGGPGHDFFCKMDPKKINYSEMTRQITSENAKDIEAIEEIIGREMNALYEIEVEKKIAAFEKHLQTLDSKTIPKYQFTSFSKYTQQLDGKEGRPDFSDTKNVDYNAYQKNSEFKKKIDDHCNSLMPKNIDNVPLRYYNKFAKMLVQANQSKGLTEELVKGAQDNLRAKFCVDEHRLYKCHQKNEGVIFYDKGEDNFPESLREIQKTSKTKAGILSVERISKKAKKNKLFLTIPPAPLSSTARTSHILTKPNASLKKSTSVPSSPHNRWIPDPDSSTTPSSESLSPKKSSISRAGSTSSDNSSEALTPLSDSEFASCIPKSSSFTMDSTTPPSSDSAKNPASIHSPSSSRSSHAKLTFALRGVDEKFSRITPIPKNSKVKQLDRPLSSSFPLYFETSTDIAERQEKEKKDREMLTKNLLYMVSEVSNKNDLALLGKIFQTVTQTVQNHTSRRNSLPSKDEASERIRVKRFGHSGSEG